VENCLTLPFRIFDKSVPRIYREATDQIFRDPRPGAEQSLLGSDEWSVLADICDSDPMHLELMAKLLDTERQYAVMGRRAGIYETLEKCFETSSRNKEDAIQQAHQKRDLKNALEAKDIDIDKVKQITTWADLKFKKL
jgi:DNA sulfur modification protein DndC